PVHRQYHHDEITFSMVYAYSENYVLPLSHDEVVHGKGSLLYKNPGDEWRRFAGLRALLGYMWAHPGKQLLFMGGEIGQGEEWSHEAGVQWWLLDHAYHRGVKALVKDVNAAYRGRSALWSLDTDPAGFQWIDGGDAAGNTLAFLRYGADGSALACLVNFSAVPHDRRRIGLPAAGTWHRVLDSDAERYGGSGHAGGVPATVQAVAEPWHGRPAPAVRARRRLATVWRGAESRVRCPAEDRPRGRSGRGGSRRIVGRRFNDRFRRRDGGDVAGERRRIEALDVLRGFALCGILLVNIGPVTGMGYDAVEAGRISGPAAPELWLHMLVGGRFFPIFSFLFGIGFAIFLDSAADRHPRPRLLLLRRLAALGLLGALHQTLHPGEALLPYAVFGLLVLVPASF